jgi:CYTH domain-containing protein
MRGDMAREIERKFLVRDDSWKSGATGIPCRQGYLAGGGAATVRVRVLGDEAYLTVKGKTVGISRDEFEYAIPSDDARAMLDDLCGGKLVEKIRYRVDVQGVEWEVDEFLGANAGLVLAEVELESEDQRIPLPGWIGREVTGEVRYYNSVLAEKPFTSWER